MTANVRDLLAFEAARAREYLRPGARRCSSGLDARALVAAEIMGRIYRETLDRIEKAGYDVFSARIRVPRRAPGRHRRSTRGCAPGSDVMSRPDVDRRSAPGLPASARRSGWSRPARVCSCVEERRRLGGRATAFADPQTGEIVDNGQHALFGCYHETFASFAPSTHSAT